MNYRETIPSPGYRIPVGELPPPPPKTFFGREEVVEKIVKLAEDLAPVALIGPGGIGKTSVALAVLHHDRIRERFGDNRRFIRCDKFSASRANLLNQLSKAVAANIENPEDLAFLRSFLPSREILIVLDNAESILDSQGNDARAIYDLVKELGSELGNICLVITSRVTTIPPDFQCLSVPTLSMDAARSTFLRIFNRNERPDLVDKILEELDFHPLSVTLLATVARENDWDNDRLCKEWGKRQTDVLRTEHNNNLAATIELSLGSPTFKALGPDAQELLGVIAFYPQGVNENNADWLFPAISNKDMILNKLCILSLTYRSNGCVTMLAPLRDHFRPRDPKSSPLLRATKEHYFTRLSVNVHPGFPGFEDTRWILSEDVNVEHLLDVFTSIDADSDDVWRASGNLMDHLNWHRPRLTVLGSKIERLSDRRGPKPTCLLNLSSSYFAVGNYAEDTRLLTDALKLGREGGDDKLVADVLGSLSDVNRMLGRHKEGIQQVKEASEIYERLGLSMERRDSLIGLAYQLHGDGQLDAAEEVALDVIGHLPEKGQEYLASQSHRVLGEIYRAGGKREKAIHHCEEALRIISTLNYPLESCWIHYSLAELFNDQYKFDRAHAHIEQAKKYAIDDAHSIGRVMEVHADIWCRQRRFENAISEAQRAVEIFEKVGAADDMERVRDHIRRIKEGKGPCSTPVNIRNRCASQNNVAFIHPFILTS